MFRSVFSNLQRGAIVTCFLLACQGLPLKAGALAAAYQLGWPVQACLLNGLGALASGILDCPLAAVYLHISSFLCKA